MLDMLKVRYRFIRIVIAVGVVISYITFYLGNQMFISNRLEKNSRDAEEDTYTSQRCFLVTSDTGSDEEEFTGMLNSDLVEASEIFFSEFPIYVDSARSSYSCSRIYINKTVEYPYLFAEGDMVGTVGGGYARQVTLGVQLRKYTYSEDGNDYIDLYKEKYLVTGYVTDRDSVIYDSMLIFDYNYLGDRMKDALTDGLNSYHLVIRGTGEEDILDFNMLMRSAEEFGVELSVQYNYEPLYATAEKDSLYTKCAIVSYVFCVFILVLVMMLWTNQRRTEFCIRIMDGFSQRQISHLVARDVVHIVIPETVVLFIIQLILHTQNSFYFVSYRTVYEIVSLILYIVITSLLLISCPKAAGANLYKGIYEGEQTV